MATEGLGGGDHPERSAVSRDQQLTGARVGQLVALELAADVRGVFSSEIEGGGAVAVGPLDDDSLCVRNV